MNQHLIKGKNSKKHIERTFILNSIQRKIILSFPHNIKIKKNNKYFKISILGICILSEGQFGNLYKETWHTVILLRTVRKEITTDLSMDIGVNSFITVLF